MNIYLDNLASALGSRVQSVEEAAANGQLFSPAAALRDAGFVNHHVCNNDEGAYDLAAKALSVSAIDPASLSAIVYATCLPMNGDMNSQRADAPFAASRDVKHVMQFPASRLQAEFGMHQAFIVGLNQQACTGMLGSLRIARNLLLAEQEMQEVLCITADRFPPGAKYEQAYNLISDGAAACKVSRSTGRFRLLDIHHISNGAMVGASDDETVGSYFNYTARLVAETLQRNDLKMGNVRWVVPQNTNRKAWTILSRLLQLSSEQAWFPTIETAGHVISADNIINLAGLASSSELKTGDRILTFMAGFGSNWQCALLEAS